MSQVSPDHLPVVDSSESIHEQIVSNPNTESSQQHDDHLSSQGEPQLTDQMQNEAVRSDEQCSAVTDVNPQNTTSLQTGSQDTEQTEADQQTPVLSMSESSVHYSQVPATTEETLEHVEEGAMSNDAVSLHHVPNVTENSEIQLADGMQVSDAVSSMEGQTDPTENITQSDLIHPDLTQSDIADHVDLQSGHQAEEMIQETPVTDDGEETTTIFAYIDSEGNLRGRSSTGEDLLLEVQGEMPEELTSGAILDDNGDLVVIQNCDPDSMLHTEGDVTYIVQQQPDNVEEETVSMDVSEAPDVQSHVVAPADVTQEESASAAANLVYLEEEVCSLETAEFQTVGVEVETQGSETHSEPSIIIDGCQVICQEPAQQKKKRSPSKGETSPAKSNGNKPKKPRKRKSSQKDTAPSSLQDSEEPKEKVTVQNLYDKSIEMCITENSSSQSQTAETVSETPKNNVPLTVAEVATAASTETPQPKPRRKSKSDGSKPRRRSKKTPERDNMSQVAAMPLQNQPRFEESDLSKTLNTATSVINQTMSAVGCEEGSADSVMPIASSSQQAFNCRLCNKFSSHSEDEVKTHIVKEHARKICFIYRCDLCPAFFVTEPEITEHFRQKHPVAHVENISIVTNIEKALQTSADNIRIFYEQKKVTPGSSPSSARSSQPPPLLSPAQLKDYAGENRADRADLMSIQGDINAILESQMKTAISDNLPISAVRDIPVLKSVAPGHNLIHSGHPGTPTAQGPVHSQLETVQAPLSAPPQLPLPAGSQPYTSYVCKICSDFSSPIQWLVRNHVLSEHIRNFPSVVYLCYACPFVGKSRDNIDNHIIKDHPGLPTNKVKVISDLEMLLILYASATDISQKGKIFHWNVKTNNHEEVQQGTRTGVLTKYVCSVCDKFETHFEWHLRHHIAQEHTEGVGYLCDLCCIFGTMEKHKAMLHSRLRHPKEQPNYKVLDWAVIFETVVRVTDNYYTAKVGTANAVAPNYFFGPGQLASAALSASSGVTVTTANLPSTPAISTALPPIHATFQATTVLEPGQVPPTIAAQGQMPAATATPLQPMTVTTPVVQQAIKSTRAMSMSPAQPVDYSMAVSQSTPANTSSVTSVVSSSLPPRSQIPQTVEKIASELPAVKERAKPGTATSSDIIPAVVVSLQEPPVRPPAQPTQSIRQAPPPPLVLPPSGPQKPLGNDVHSFRCLVCHYTSLSLPDIVKHITVWHVDATMYPYTCPLCDLPGWEYNIILDHLRQIHKSSNYLPIINPGKVEFLRRYVNRFWIEHRPPALVEAQQTPKTPRRRKRKASVQVQETPNKPATSAHQPPPLSATATQPQLPATVVPSPTATQQAPQLIQQQPPPPPLQRINTPVNIPPALKTPATPSVTSPNAAVVDFSNAASPMLPSGQVSVPVNNSPASAPPKPKRRRRSNQQKAIQENFQIQPPGLVIPGLQGGRPHMIQHAGQLDPRFGSPQPPPPRLPPHTPSRPPQPSSVIEIPFTPPGVAPAQRPTLSKPIQAIPQNMQHPVQTPPQPAPIPQMPPAPTSNKKGRNLDKGIRYYCKLCSYSTPQLVYADSHAKCTHLKIRPFYCPYCTSFSGALEHKAKMHVTFKHKDQPLKIEVNEEAVALLEIEARKLYEARRTDDNSVVDLTQSTESPRGRGSSGVGGPLIAEPMPVIQLQPAPVFAATEIVVPVSVTEEIATESSDAQVMPTIPSIQITEAPSSGEITDELQIAVQSLMEGSIPDDVPLPTSVEAMTTPTEETAVVSEEPVSMDLSLPVQSSQLVSGKLSPPPPPPPVPTPESGEKAAPAVMPQDQVAATSSQETSAQRTEPVVQHAVTEIAETMASMCSQVVIHQPKQLSADEGGDGHQETQESDNTPSTEVDTVLQAAESAVENTDVDPASLTAVSAIQSTEDDHVTHTTVSEIQSTEADHVTDSTVSAVQSTEADHVTDSTVSAIQSTEAEPSTHTTVSVIQNTEAEPVAHTTVSVIPNTAGDPVTCPTVSAIQSTEAEPVTHTTVSAVQNIEADTVTHTSVSVIKQTEHSELSTEQITIENRASTEAAIDTATNAVKGLVSQSHETVMEEAAKMTDVPVAEQSQKIEGMSVLETVQDSDRQPVSEDASDASENTSSACITVSSTDITATPSLVDITQHASLAERTNSSILCKSIVSDSKPRESESIVPYTSTDTAEAKTADSEVEEKTAESEDSRMKHVTYTLTEQEGTVIIESSMLKAAGMSPGSHQSLELSANINVSDRDTSTHKTVSHDMEGGTDASHQKEENLCRTVESDSVNDSELQDSEMTDIIDSHPISSSETQTYESNVSIPNSSDPNTAYTTMNSPMQPSVVSGHILTETTLQQIAAGQLVSTTRNESVITEKDKFVKANVGIGNDVMGMVASDAHKNQSVSSVKQERENIETRCIEHVENISSSENVSPSEYLRQQPSEADTHDSDANLFSTKVYTQKHDLETSIVQNRPASSEKNADTGGETTSNMENNSSQIIEEPTASSQYVNCDGTAESKTDTSDFRSADTFQTAVSTPNQNNFQNSLSHGALNRQIISAITPDMVGDLAMDIVQETVADLMTSISVQTVKEASIVKPEHVDKVQSVIVGRVTIDHFAPQDIFCNTSKLITQQNDCLKHEIFSNSRSSDGLLSVKGDLCKSIIKMNGNHLPKPMPLSVKLARYPALNLNGSESGPAQRRLSSDDESLSIKKRCFYCKHCCCIVNAKKEIETHIICKHVTVKPYRCSNCKFCTSRYSKILKHVEGVHAKEPHKRILTDRSLVAQLRSETDESFSFVYTAIEDCSDPKLFLRPVVLLPNIFEVLTESGNL